MVRIKTGMLKNKALQFKAHRFAALKTDSVKSAAIFVFLIKTSSTCIP